MLKRALLLSVFLAGASGVAHAQMVRGQVLVPSVRHSERIEVRLEKLEGPVAARTYSDTQGHFEFRVAPGRYVVVVNLEGYNEERITVDVGTGVFGTAIVNIPLEETPVFRVRDSSAGDPTIDVTELNRNYPKPALDAYEDALEANREGKVAEAQTLLERAIELAPDFYNAHLLLGSLYQKANRYRDAEKEYTLAREQNARSADPIINLGSLYIQEAEAVWTADKNNPLYGRILDEALDALEAAVALDSKSALAYYLLGSANYLSAFYPAAEQHLKQALVLEERFASARLMLSNVYIRLEKNPEAIAQIDAYLKENPRADNRAEVEQTRARLLQNQNP